MACFICGSRAHEAMTDGCPKSLFWNQTRKPVGWRCPVCNKGNAPHSDICGHCAKPLDTVGNNAGVGSYYGKLSFGGGP